MIIKLFGLWEGHRGQERKEPGILSSEVNFYNSRQSVVSGCGDISRFTSEFNVCLLFSSGLRTGWEEGRQFKR